MHMINYTCKFVYDIIRNEMDVILLYPIDKMVVFLIIYQDGIVI